MPTICITNQKGGCGKTMTAINLGAGLARQDQRVLLVDLIHKGRWRRGSGALPPRNCCRSPRPFGALLDRIVVSTPTAGLWVIPSDTSLDAQAFYKKPRPPSGGPSAPSSSLLTLSCSIRRPTWIW